MARKTEQALGAGPDPEAGPGVAVVSDIPGGDDDSPADPALLAEVGGSGDPVALAFAGPSADGFRVELWRKKPAIWRGEDITGYVDDLQPYPDDSIQTIKARFGGGTYNIIRRGVNGKIMWGQTFKIAGPPVVSPSEVVPLTPASVPTKNDDLDSSQTITINGVTLPYTRDLQEIKSLMVFVMAVRAMFPEPKQEDPLALIARLREAFPELSFGGQPESSGGDGWAGAIAEVAKNVLGPMVSGPAMRPAVRPVARPMPPARPSLPVSSTSNPQPEPNPAPESEANSVAQPSPQAVALTAIQEILKAFAMDPPQPAADVVSGLDLMLGQFGDMRKQIAPFKGALASMAERNLGDYFEDYDPGLIARFREYFNQVFDSYVDPSRVSL